MIRLLILTLVAMSLMVMVRLLLVRSKMPPRQPQSHPPPVIEAVGPIVIKNYMFVNFDCRKGPKDPEEFYENFYVNVGEAGSDAVRTFSFYVTTPRALSTIMRINKQDYKFGRNLLVVERYDMDVILRAVSEHLTDLRELGEDVG